MADVTRGTGEVQGTVGHDVADTGNPIKIGGKAETGEPTAVDTNGDRVDAWFDATGRIVVAQWHPQELTPTVETKSTTAEADAIAAPGAGVALYICSILVTNGGATLSRVTFRDGALGTIRCEGWAAKNGGGFMWSPLRPWKLTVNTALRWELSATTTDIRATIEYFTMA